MKLERIVVCFVVIIVLIFSLIGCSITEKVEDDEINEVMEEKISKIEYREIEEYIKSINGYYEVSRYVLPNFDKLKDVNENWIWETVWKNASKLPGSGYFTREDLANEAKNLFGSEFDKEFPIEGLPGLINYSDDYKGYYCNAFGLDGYLSRVIVDDVKKTGDSYVADVVCYLQDVEDFAYAQKEIGDKTFIRLMDYNEKYIENYEFILSDNYESQLNEFVLKNKEKYTRKKVYLEVDEKTSLLKVTKIEEIK